MRHISSIVRNTVEFSLILALGTAVGCARAPGDDAPAGWPTRPQPAQKTYANQKEPSPERPIDLDAAPSTAPNELPPLDPKRAEMADPEPVSPEDLNRHRRVMDELWGTTLGQIFLSYVTAETPPQLIPHRAQQMLDQIFAEGEHAGKRLKLITLLTADMYARGKMDVEFNRRMLVLDSMRESRAKKGEDGGNAGQVAIALAMIPLTLPLGSKPFEQEFNKVLHYVSHRCVGRKCEPFSASWAHTGGLKNIAQNYRFKRHKTYLLASLGIALTVYNIYFLQWPGLKRSAVRDDKMLNGRDDLIEKAQF